MRYLSVCSGIEAATVAWHPLGWTPAAFSEIEAFPRAVLAHHYPSVPLHGDFTTIEGKEYGPIDLLVGGTPCQDFSVAGLRAGITGDRGNLTLEFLRLAARTKPRWIVWENVPGVLSSDGGRALGAFLGGLAEFGYGFAYRVFDAQYFGLAQRRARVFVVGYLGDWRRAAAVLFERESLLGNPAPRREAGKGVTPILEAGARTGKSTTDLRAGSGIGEPGDPMFTLQAGKQHAIAPTIPARTKGGGGLGTDFDCDGGLITRWPTDLAPTLNAHFGDKQGLENQHIAGGGGLFVPTTRPLPERRRDFDASEDGTGRGTPLVSMTFDWQAGGGHHKSHAIGGVMPAVAFNNTGQGWWNGADAAATVRKGDDQGGGGACESTLVATTAVRRLTPRECERLQGFPDDYTLVPYRGKPAADGPRYKALGNSMAVPCMRWIGERIALVERLSDRRRCSDKGR